MFSLFQRQRQGYCAKSQSIFGFVCGWCPCWCCCQRRKENKSDICCECCPNKIKPLQESIIKNNPRNPQSTKKLKKPPVLKTAPQKRKSMSTQKKPSEVKLKTEPSNECTKTKSIFNFKNKSDVK